ncbi:DMT family transporter [Halomonas sp. M4R1S46]|uniref:DMT family transporter n=1 Tax=Halomonas sp. M4R1S46 TaxID=2982692 RepID=UPI0021E4569A|nr:DMT family transporter [Halomonas sp. M4R1S46]UYG07026.1 DMT family transporter [Halomonas sp. M4R1S46]
MQDESNQRARIWQGGLLALLATTIWAGNFVAARAASASIDPIALAFLRWSLASALLLPFVANRLLAARRALAVSWKGIVVASFFGITAFNTSVYIAGNHIGATHMSLVNAAAPILILLLSVSLLGERVSWVGILGMLLAAGGILLSARDGGSADLTVDMGRGLAWMTLAASCFAIYTVMFRRLLGRLPFMVLVGSSFLMGTLLLLPLFAWRVAVVGMPEWSGQNLFLIGYAGIAASLVAFVCWNRAVALIGAAQAGYVYYLVPFLSAALSVVFLGELPGPWTLVAAPLVVLGIVLAVRDGRR